MRRILVLGGGFCGIAAARDLSKRLSGRAEIVLVDDQPEFVFQPQLIEALEDKVSEADLRTPLADIAKRDGFRILRARTRSIDPSASRAMLVEGDREFTEPFDILVVATGGKTAYYGTPGAETHALPLKTGQDLDLLKNRLTAAANRAKDAKTDAERDLWLRIAVVGGGPTGIELALAAKGRMAHLLADAPELAKRVDVHVFQSMPQILAGFPKRCIAYAEKVLLREGVTVHAGHRVVSVEKNAIATDAPERLEAGTLLWCAGVGAAPPAFAGDASVQLRADGYLRTHANVFAGGDVVDFSYKQLRVPKNGQTARLMGLAIAENVARLVDGKELKPFRYFSKGAILVLGDDACIELPVGFLKGRWLVPIRRFFYKLMHRSLVG